MRGATNSIPEVYAKPSQIPTKVSSTTVQHVDYWRMAEADTWTGIYTNNTDNIQVGWLRYQASGSNGTLSFIMGGGNYVEQITISDFEVHIMPLVIPPHTTLNYMSSFFINAWATLYELVLGGGGVN